MSHSNENRITGGTQNNWTTTVQGNSISYYNCTFNGSRRTRRAYSPSIPSIFEPNESNDIPDEVTTRVDASISPPPERPRQSYALSVASTEPFGDIIENINQYHDEEVEQNIDAVAGIQRAVSYASSISSLQQYITPLDTRRNIVNRQWSESHHYQIPPVSAPASRGSSVGSTPRTRLEEGRRNSTSTVRSKSSSASSTSSRKSWLNRIGVLKEESTPQICKAARDGHFGVVETLLTQKTANARDRERRTPLSLAAGNKHQSIIQLLLDFPGVDVNSQCGNGRTPLSYAAEAGDVGIVAILLALNDVKVTLTDLGGHSPLDYATRRRRKAVVELIEKKLGIRSVVSAATI